MFLCHELDDLPACEAEPAASLEPLAALPGAGSPRATTVARSQLPPDGPAAAILRF